MQSKPVAQRLAAERFTSELQELLNGGLEQVIHASVTGVPAEPRVWSAITWVPFLMICLEGEFDAQIFDGQQMQTQRIPAGHGIFFEPHVWVDVHHQRCKRYLRITFDEDHILCGLKDCSSAQQRREIGSLATYVHPHIFASDGQALLHNISHLPRDVHETQRCTDYARCLCWKTYDALSYQQNPPSTAEGTWLAIRDWCARHCCDGISRSDVCEAFQLSPSHVSRLCTEFNGNTLIEFIQQQQLRHACIYLRETPLSMHDIAQRCAFNSANYFIRIFGRHMGISPVKWRRQQIS
ncbi:MAG: helix-turn-helix transcriptional regulator [Planctomycetes bacterium]|nr:helix-turn-helix transcriptional regulator [Planctomycetota bacterium]